MVSKYKPKQYSKTLIQYNKN